MPLTYVRRVEQKTVTIEVEASEAVVQVKRKIQQQQGIPIERQDLAFSGVQLRDDCTLQNARVRWIEPPPPPKPQAHIIEQPLEEEDRSPTLRYAVGLLLVHGPRRSRSRGRAAGGGGVAGVPGSALAMDLMLVDMAPLIRQGLVARVQDG
mmetsp:Transcript_141223/g.393577  ORF Transcript_141223/g.393577 Transcript_141223/m.393577 type:complete len:151 (-) Transcript_141223:80-532(-)